VVVGTLLIKNQINQTGDQVDSTIQSLANQVDLKELGQIIKAAGPTLKLLAPFGECFQGCLSSSGNPSVESCLLECASKSLHG